MDDSLFDRLPLFQDLLPEHSCLIRPLFTPCFETPGSILFEQGELADRLYLVIVGEVVIRYKPEDGPAILIAHVRTGGLVGWSAALGNPIYTSSAVCTSECQMLIARGQDLRAFCEQHPKEGSFLLERLARVVAERLRTSHEHVIALLEQSFQVNGQKSLTTG